MYMYYNLHDNIGCPEHHVLDPRQTPGPTQGKIPTLTVHSV